MERLQSIVDTPNHLVFVWVKGVGKHACFAYYGIVRNSIRSINGEAVVIRRYTHSLAMSHAELRGYDRESCILRIGDKATEEYLTMTSRANTCSKKSTRYMEAVWDFMGLEHAHNRALYVSPEPLHDVRLFLL